MIARFASRLTGIKENSKFQKNGEKNEQAIGLKHVVDDAKQCRDVNVRLCLACFGRLLGGGVKPAATGMEHYDTRIGLSQVRSHGVVGNQPDVVMDSLSVHGLGLVHPKKCFQLLQ
ncbi:hypothetical protein OIU78_017738 [Salix suchowensis]|nr:hypothetical protein OIU78_017738 [Salix suchowensis]